MQTSLTATEREVLDGLVRLTVRSMVFEAHQYAYAVGGLMYQNYLIEMERLSARRRDRS